MNIKCDCSTNCTTHALIYLKKMLLIVLFGVLEIKDIHVYAFYTFQEIK